MWYIEDENSQMIDRHRPSAMHKMVCSNWAALENARKAPVKWSQADIIISQSYRCEMWVHIPELQLCENNWKVDLIASDNYPSWYSHNANKQTIKQENANGVDISYLLQNRYTMVRVLRIVLPRRLILSKNL